MANITASLVAKLREMTGAGLMDCKKALIQAKGELDAAVEVLRKEGTVNSQIKSAREAREGLIAQHIAPGGHLGVLVEINCQTDFVARNEMFRAFADDVARRLAADPKADFEADRVQMVAKIRENIQIARHARMEVSGHGLIAAYIHTGAKVGVLVEVGAGKESTEANDDFKQLVKDITLQIAAGHPFVVARTEVPADVLAKEKEIAAEQFKNKPPQAIAKIVEGKLEKFYQENCLLEQSFIKDPAVTIKDLLAQKIAKIGENMNVRRFTRYQLGEA